MFSVVLPISKYSYLLSKTTEEKREPTAAHNNFERFCKIGLQTYLKYMTWDDVYEFIIILPRADEQELLNMLEHVGIPTEIRKKFVLIHQEDLLGKAMTQAFKSKHRLAKTRTQMLLKLVVADRIKTPQYLIVDDDVVLLRPFGYKHMFADQKRQALKFTPDLHEHEEWWHGSCNVLVMDWSSSWKAIQQLRKINWVINVTPEIFYTQHTRELVQRLCEFYGSQGAMEQHMFETPDKWTEYTLYWLYLLDLDVMKKVYRGSRVRISDGSKSVWYACPNLEEKVTIMKNNKNQYFGVIQSNVPEHTIDVVADVVKRVVLS